MQTVSHRARGESDINQEITSDTNPYFVIHDSKGYEAGDTSIFDELVTFIDDRVKRIELSEKIHMVWICIATPCAGSRVLEYRTEHIIKLCVENELPFLVVFTKYDELVAECFLELADSDSGSCETPEDEDEIKRMAAENAIKERHNFALNSFRSFLTFAMNTSRLIMRRL
ncbi:hypothetical protein DL96DRAFT_351282 [Flagelloscypha sp. PMI_526]|nr:hypothetical protein DL96DRAFT_351282 [Flagelloscypha sp. PMI_526]